MFPHISVHLCQVFTHFNAMNIAKKMFTSPSEVVALNCKAGFHRTSTFVALLSAFLFATWLVCQQQALVRQKDSLSVGYQPNDLRWLAWNTASLSSVCLAVDHGRWIAKAFSPGWRSLLQRLGPLTQFTVTLCSQWRPVKSMTACEFNDGLCHRETIRRDALQRMGLDALKWSKIQIEALYHFWKCCNCKPYPFTLQSQHRVQLELHIDTLMKCN